MAKAQADLRLIIRDGSRLALAWQATIKGEDVYAGSPAGPGGEIMRLSYHASGVTHFHLQGQRLAPGGPSPAPRDVRGWHRVASWSVLPLSWGYKPKPDSSARVNVTVDSDVVPIPMESWVVTLVAAERARDDVIETVLDHYRSDWLLIAHVVAHCAHVNLIGVLSTIGVETWNRIQEQIAARPEPGPLQRALLLERKAFVAEHRSCGGFESGVADGRTWMVCTRCGVRIERARVPDGA